VTVAESALERQLPVTIMRGGSKPAIGRRPRARCSPSKASRATGSARFSTVCSVYGLTAASSVSSAPGAVVGERALLEDGRRTATLRAVTGCVIAAAARQIDRGALARLAGQHHREDTDR
jgi:hypothetical protein